MLRGVVGIGTFILPSLSLPFPTLSTTVWLREYMNYTVWQCALVAE